MKFNKSYSSVVYLTVTQEHVGRRLDNYLVGHLKNVAPVHILKLIRRGEVRVNMKRCRPSHRLSLQDSVRIPPMHRIIKPESVISQEKIQWMQEHILYEDHELLVFNKPSGLSCHGGSGIKFALIEGLRQLKQEYKCLELVHRLDKGTSGCVLLTKNKRTLRELHRAWSDQQVDKIYWLFVTGRWPYEEYTVNDSLASRRNSSGERTMVVDEAGKPACTRFKLQKHLDHHSFLSASPETGRTHQIRVHAAAMGHPILGDEKYGAEQNTLISRLCLHARQLKFTLNDEPKVFTAPMPGEMSKLLDAPT